MSAVTCGFCFTSLACRETQPGPAASEDSRDAVTGLTKAEEALVLAEVGSRKITLGDYAHTLRTMGKFERLRYQTPERQKELLEQMIDLELLAQEARRRGLDKKPEVVLGHLQALRDQMLEELRAGLPKPEALSEREVQEYYDAHKEEFEEPDRRRALVIVVKSEVAARRALEELKGQGAEKWGEVARKYSLEKRGLGAGEPPELAGDLGFISRPGEPRGANPAIPEAVRVALFQLEKLGDVTPAPILADTNFYLVRLGALSAARHRTLAEADRTIRVELLRQMFLKKEAEFQKELEAKYPLVVNEEKLAEWQRKVDGARPSKGAPSP